MSQAGGARPAGADHPAPDGLCCHRSFCPTVGTMRSRPCGPSSWTWRGSCGSTRRVLPRRSTMRGRGRSASGPSAGARSSGRSRSGPPNRRHRRNAWGFRDERTRRDATGEAEPRRTEPPTTKDVRRRARGGDSTPDRSGENLRETIGGCVTERRRNRMTVEGMGRTRPAVKGGRPLASGESPRGFSKRPSRVNDGLVTRDAKGPSARRGDGLVPSSAVDESRPTSP